MLTVIVKERGPAVLVSSVMLISALGSPRPVKVGRVLTVVPAVGAGLG